MTDEPIEDGSPPSRDRGSRTHAVVHPNSDEIDGDGGGWSHGLPAFLVVFGGKDGREMTTGFQASDQYLDRSATG
ncbi:hypothetical protein AB3S75_029343 [Citrus x aurantiifolia]